ncbi:MAG TPA: hypothetical protein VGD69_02935 [Herpetosiphonaceae bacterium]
MNLLIVIVGVVLGAIMGGVLGMLLGLGALAIPGFGPMIAAGSLATMLGTASISAIVGALLGGGICLLLVMLSTRRRSFSR